jgi:hypothetical protein
MFTKLNCFGGRFGYRNNEHNLSLIFGEVPPGVLTVAQCQSVKSAWIQTCHFDCLHVAGVKALMDKFPNAKHLTVVEGGWKSSRRISWADATHVKQVVRQAMGTGRAMELLLEAEEAHPYADDD